MLDQLAYFAEVYRHRSISRAADFLHISRQALSHSIKTLEAELGVPLFERQTDGVLPTPAADALYTSARIILREEAAIRQAMRTYAEAAPQIHQYTIAAPQSTITIYGEALIAQLARDFPHDMFVLSTIKNSDDTALSQKDINIQLKLSPQTRKSMQVPADYECIALHQLPMSIWIHAASALAQVPALDYATLRTYPVSVLKNIVNGSEYATMLDLSYDPIVEVPSNLKDNIRRLGHYTIDFMLQREHLMLEDLFADAPDILSRQTLESMYVYLIYRKDLDQALIDRIVATIDPAL